MRLKCRINNIDYDIIQGAHFSDVFGETLDSGSIIIAHVPKIYDIEPYDDVYIWDAEYNFVGYDDTKNYFTNTEYMINVDKQDTLYTFDFPNELKTFINKKGVINLDFTISMIITYRNAGQTTTKTVPYSFSESYNLFPKNNGMLPFQSPIFSTDGHGWKRVFAAESAADIISIKFKISAVEKDVFYKHLLIDRFSEEKDILTQNVYTYKIELFSETKALEKTVLPNICVTQPLNKSKKTSSYERMKRLLELYSPKIKINYYQNLWQYKQKYMLSEQVKNIFEEEYCYDFGLNQPTLREALSKIMITKDCIPYVKNDVIYAMNLSERKNNIVLNADCISSITGTKSSSDYVDTLRTTYSNAINNQNVCHRVEYLGFRNSGQSLLTLDNLQLETTFPIYKIKKMYLCYYKRLKFKNGYVTFLCKQDMTDLCVLDNERQLLWKDVRLSSFPAASIYSMKNFYYYTVGYSIGSNVIKGFGERFNLKKTLGLINWNKENIVIRNILDNLDASRPYGSTYIKQDFSHYEQTYGEFVDFDTTTIQAHSSGDGRIMSNLALSYKTLFFQVEYDAFFNGVIENDKSNSRNKVTTVDNQNASLTLLSIDGISKQSKIRKLGNKNFQISGIYDSFYRLENGVKKCNILDLASVFDFSNQTNFVGDDDYDVVLYNREYNFYDNQIEFNYFAAKSYVLKNYFTSVYAKQRLFNVLDYGSSVVRAEHKKEIILFSKNKQYANNEMPFVCDLSKVLSFFLETTSNSKPINIAYIKTQKNWQLIKTFSAVENLSYGVFFSDANVIAAATSLIFNTRMATNFSTGMNIAPSDDPTESAHPYEPDISLSFDDNNNDNFKGTLQRDNAIYDDYETGMINKIGFGFANYKDFFSEDIVAESSNGANAIVDSHIKRSFALPSVYCNDADDGMNKDQYLLLENKIYKENMVLYKDAKEQIDMSYQIECLVEKESNDSIFIGDRLLQLSEYFGQKKEDNYTPVSEKIEIFGYQYRCAEVNIPVGGGAGVEEYVSTTFATPAIVVKIEKESLEKLIVRTNYENVSNFVISFDTSNLPNPTEYYNTWGTYAITGYNLIVKKIKISVTSGGTPIAVIQVERNATISKITRHLDDNKNPYNSWDYYGSSYSEMTLNLPLVEVAKDNNETEDSQQKYCYFSNIEMKKASGKKKAYPYSNVGTNLFSDPVITKEGGVLENIGNVTHKIGRNTILTDGEAASCFGSTLYTVKYNYFYNSYSSPYYIPNYYLWSIYGDVNQSKTQYKVINANEWSGDENDLQGSGSFKTIPSGSSYEILVPGINELDDEQKTCAYSQIVVDTKIGNKNIFYALSENELSAPDTFVARKDLEDINWFRTAKVSNIIYFNNSEKKITISLPNSMGNLDNYKSIQFWFYDYDEGMYYFVFGVNMTSEEKQRRNITIYISQISDKDMRVYDEKHNFVGYVKNCANEQDKTSNIIDRL